MLETNLYDPSRRSSSTVDQILEIATDVFAEHGYHGTSVMDIVKRSGMSQEYFNRFFHSKRDIFLALLEKYYTELTLLLEKNHRYFIKVFDGGKDPLAAWRDNTTRIFEYHAGNPGLTHIALRDAMAMDEDYSWRVQQLTRLVKLQYMESLQLMEGKGMIREPDIELVATILQSAANGIILSYVANGTQRRPEELAGQLMAYFTKALSPAAAAPAEAVDSADAVDSPEMMEIVAQLSPVRPRRKRKTGKMPKLVMGNDLSKERFFEEAINRIFEDQVSSSDRACLQDIEITMQFTIESDHTFTYGLRVTGGSNLEIVRGGLDDPMIAFEMSEEVYWHALDGKVAEAMQTFVNLSQITDRKRYDTIRELRGCLSLELTLDDGSVLPFKITFNGAGQPAVVFRMGLDDYIAMGRGELYGMSAFVSGRLDMEGDKPFAMQLSDLLR